MYVLARDVQHIRCRICHNKQRREYHARKKRQKEIAAMLKEGRALGKVGP